MKVTQRVEKTKSLIWKEGSFITLGCGSGESEYNQKWFFSVTDGGGGVSPSTITYMLQNKNNIHAKSNGSGVPSCAEKGNVFFFFFIQQEKCNFFFSNLA